ncbi:MAG TPA: flagellar hook-basal body complex protein, partial [Oligoflexia bacterium]|nr:flagellar hook-basal body complex protein [Oligoflexia bacterium]
FKINEDGNLVTPDGYLLTPNITIPNDTIGITVSTDGIVSVTQPGAATATELGQIQTARFQNPAGLRSKGRNLYEETESSGTATLGTPGENGLGTIAQGFLESSNVSVVEEVVQMVTGQRAYEANSKVITTADQLLQTAINLKR